jgi:hypothetical protein
MERTVEMGGKYGFRVILALSPEPAGEQADYWESDELKASIVEMSAKIAHRFKGNSAVAGYDLINEPVIPRDRNHPPSADRPTKSIDGVAERQGQNANLWRDLATKMIQAIRNEDPESVVVFEPSPWGATRGFVGLTPLPFPRIVYSFHFYDPHELTHQGLYENRAILTYPNEAAHLFRLSKTMEPVREFSRKYGMPIFVGEFSIVRWAPGDSVTRYLSDVIDLFEAENWNWAYHSFREYEGWDPELDSELPKGVRGRRSGNARAIRLLTEKGFGKNSRSTSPR